MTWSALGFLGRRLMGGPALPERTAPAPVRSALIEYGRRTFVKSYRQEVALEFRRGLAMYEASLRSGCYRAARPLLLIESHDLILWESVDDLEELRTYLARDIQRRPGDPSSRVKLFEQSGRSLAAIHESFRALGSAREYRALSVPETGDVRLDRHVADRLRESVLRPLHWDFVCGNLFVIGGKTAAPTLVILDASPNWYLFPPDGLDVASPIYVDGATLAFSLLCHPRFSAVVKGEADSYLDAFVSGYRQEAGFAFDRPTMSVAAAEVCRIYQDFIEGHEVPSRTGRREARFRAEARRRLLASAAAGLPSLDGEEALHG